MDIPSRSYRDRKEAIAIGLIELLGWIRSNNVHQVRTLERVFGYKASANNQLLAKMRHLDDASPAKEIAVRILSHTYIVDRIFAANLMRAEHGYTSPNSIQAPSLEKLAEMIATSDQWYVNYVSLLDETDLAEGIDFTFTDGAPGRMSREEILMHVTIHGEYHRGQIGIILMQNAITPPPDAFTGYLHKVEATARRRQA